MAGLPKIALARLKAQPGAQKSASPSLGPDVFGGAGHPDANLLAGLAEKTLTDRERTQVLDHLSQCNECREIAALTLPAEDAVAEPVRVPARRQWRPWIVLRWGAEAAVMATLAVVVVLHRDMWNQHRNFSMDTRPLAPQEKVASVPQILAPSPLALPPPGPAKPKVQAEAQESGAVRALGGAAGSRQGMGLDDHVAHAKARQQVTIMALSRAPAAYRAENVQGMKVEREEAKGENSLTAGALSAPPPPAAPAPVPTATSEDAMKPGVESQVAPAASGVMATSVGAAGGNFRGSASGAAPAKAAPQMETRTTAHMTAQATMGTMQASRKKDQFEAGLPAALWSIASDGRVQRSTDGGKTIEQVLVARGIRFRAIAALGNDVWAGGSGGALFHSADAGATWIRTEIGFDENTLTETIASIELHDPQHLTVTTASGSQWVSEDGGQHWHRQP